MLAEHADPFADGGLGLDVLVVAARNPTTPVGIVTRSRPLRRRR